MFESVLVPVDGSEGAKKALDVACHIVNGTDATLYVLHVPEIPSYETALVWGIGAIAPGSSPQERDKIANQVVEQAAKVAFERGIKKIKRLIVHGDPARGIVGEANTLDIDVIVMGSRGLGDLHGLMVGSVSHKVSNVASCTVITVR